MYNRPNTSRKVIVTRNTAEGKRNYTRPAFNERNAKAHEEREHHPVDKEKISADFNGKVNAIINVADATLPTIKKMVEESETRINYSSISSVPNVQKIEIGAIVITFTIKMNGEQACNTLFLTYDAKRRMYNTIITSDKSNNSNILYFNNSEEPMLNIEKYLPTILTSTAKYLLGRINTPKK